MSNKNIVSNISLEQYNKKYNKLSVKLLSYSKKEVEEFDKKYPNSFKYRLLKGHKWALINDTYYEIPKPIRFSWFRNLHGAAKLGICVLVCGVVATSIALPIYFTNKTKEISPAYMDGDAAKLVGILSNKINDNGDRELLLKAKEERVEFKSIEVKIGNDVLKYKEEYEYNLVTTNDERSEYNLIIFKSALESHQGNISVKPILKVRLKITDGDLDLTLGEATHQLKVINEDTGEDLTDKVFYISGAPVWVTCGFSCDQDGLITPLRVGGGYVIAYSSMKDYVPYKINVNIKADESRGLKTLKLTTNDKKAGSTYSGGSYAYYTLVTAVAIAKPSYRFVEWQDKDGKHVSYKDGYDVRMSEDIELKAIFEHNLELFKRTYGDYYKTFNESTKCPYSSCTYKDALTGEVKSCTLSYDKTATPKICQATPEGMNPITVAGGEYNYDDFVGELESLKSQGGYTFDCEIEEITNNLLLRVTDSNGYIYGSYKFNPNGYLLQYGKVTSDPTETIAFSIKYN